jgi:uncharacterized membrane protein YbhN (UPF0104 family)
VKKLGWRLVGSGALLGVIAWRLDWARVGAAFAGLRLSLWLAAVGLYLVAQVISSVRWRMLARVLHLGGTVRQYVWWYYIGTFFNMCLPTSVGGDVVRAWYLARQAGPTPLGRKTSAAVSVLADRLSGLALLCVLAVGAALCSPVPLDGWMTACVAAIGIGLVAGLCSLPLARRCLTAWPGLLPAGVRLKVERLLDTVLLYRGHGRVLLSTTVLSAVIQVLNAVLVWMTSVALGLEVPLTWYCLAVPLVTLLTLLPISLNGMGLREVGYVVLLRPAGVDAAHAVTLAFLGFAVTLVSSLAGLGCLISNSERGARNSELPELRTPSSALRVRGGGASDDDPVRGDPDQGRTRQPPAAA